MFIVFRCHSLHCLRTYEAPRSCIIPEGAFQSEAWVQVLRFSVFLLFCSFVSSNVYLALFAFNKWKILEFLSREEISVTWYTRLPTEAHLGMAESVCSLEKNEEEIAWCTSTWTLMPVKTGISEWCAALRCVSEQGGSCPHLANAVRYSGNYSYTTVHA
jgi:hypothetical protein